MLKAFVARVTILRQKMKYVGNTFCSLDCFVFLKIQIIITFNLMFEFTKILHYFWFNLVDILFFNKLDNKEKIKETNRFTNALVYFFKIVEHLSYIGLGQGP